MAAERFDGIIGTGQSGEAAPWRPRRGAIFAHPTLAESLNNLFASL